MWAEDEAGITIDIYLRVHILHYNRRHPLPAVHAHIIINSNTIVADRD